VLLHTFSLMHATLLLVPGIEAETAAEIAEIAVDEEATALVVMLALAGLFEVGA